MQNPFAMAVQWPDSPRRYVVHLRKPYFTAALVETAAAAWLLVNWAPGSKVSDSAEVFRSAAEFCRRELAQHAVPIEFVERKHGYELPRYLMAQSATKELFIIEPEHFSPLVEVRDKQTEAKPGERSARFDTVTQLRLADMRKYYRQYLERQQRCRAARISAAVTA